MTDRSPETHPFHFPEIGLWLDEAEYMKASNMITNAAGLLGGCVGDNPEYERGMSELICVGMGWVPSDYSDEVLAAIHASA